MKRTVWLWQLFGFAFTSLAGTLLHFVYEFSSNSPITAPFSGVNESTFEHMKLLFWPMLIYTLFESLFFRDYESFFCIKLKGTLIGLSLIPLIFYTYNGVIGKSPDYINIAIFFIAAAAAYIYEAISLYRNTAVCHSPRLALGILLAIGAAFALFTFFTPELAIFRDPLTGTYGIPGKIKDSLWRCISPLPYRISP